MSSIGDAIPVLRAERVGDGDAGGASSPEPETPRKIQSRPPPPDGLLNLKNLHAAIEGVAGEMRAIKTDNTQLRATIARMEQGREHDRALLERIAKQMEEVQSVVKNLDHKIAPTVEQSLKDTVLPAVSAHLEMLLYRLGMVAEQDGEEEAAGEDVVVEQTHSSNETPEARLERKRMEVKEALASGDKLEALNRCVRLLNRDFFLLGNSLIPGP